MVSIYPHSTPVRRSLESVEDWQTRANLPTMYDLPSEDPEEPGLPDEYHDLQPQLLSRTLNLAQYTRSEWFTASDLNLYYDATHQKWYKRPDWFLAVGVSRLYDGEDLRRSYVVWQEGKSPDVIVEFLSVGTAPEDLGRFFDPSSPIDSGEAIAESVISDRDADEAVEKEKPPGKLEVYENYLRVPHYIVYSRYTRRLRYFRWRDGQYQEQSLQPSNPLIWLEDLGIGLGIWHGKFDEVRGYWLRWCDPEGNWLLTDTELAESQILQAARNLLMTGMELNQVIQVLGLSEVQVAALRSPE